MGITLPAMRCLCVDCQYTAFAEAVSPIAKKIVNEQNMLPHMQEMSTAICQKKDTVKCFLSGQGDCALPDSSKLGNGFPEAAMAKDMVAQQRKTIYDALDCLCTECPSTMGKVMTLGEKMDKGIPMTEAEKFQEMCGLYTDLGCFIQKDACRSAVLMLMQTVGPMTGMPTNGVPTDPAAFKTFAEQQQQNLKAECSKQGVTVVEFEESSEASFAQGLKLGLAPAALLLAAYASSA